jgi:hypothetical protein
MGFLKDISALTGSGAKIMELSHGGPRALCLPVLNNLRVVPQLRLTLDIPMNVDGQPVTTCVMNVHQGQIQPLEGDMIFQRNQGDPYAKDALDRVVRTYGCDVAVVLPEATAGRLSQPHTGTDSKEQVIILKRDQSGVLRVIMPAAAGRKPEFDQCRYHTGPTILDKAK